MKAITLKEAKEIKFKRKDDHYNRLINQDTETKVIYPEQGIEVDYSHIYMVNKMVYIQATDINNNLPCFMVIE